MSCTKNIKICRSTYVKLMVCRNSSDGFWGSTYLKKTADFDVLRDIAMATIFWLSIYIYGVHIGATWRMPNTTEPSMCGGDAYVHKRR